MLYKYNDIILLCQPLQNVHIIIMMIIFCHTQSVLAIHKITIIIRKNIQHIELHNNTENISFDTYFEKKKS